MTIREALRLELRVAFSSRAQPLWFRIVKWIAVVALAVYFWGAPGFWAWVAGLFVLALALHLVWRTKTHRWTRPWGGWNDVEVGRLDD